MMTERLTALGDKHVRDFLSSARVGHLATADRSGWPHNVPVCFWFEGSRFYFVIDQKPKRRAGTQLKRMRNIADNPHVALIVDHYEEDWDHLAYVLVQGRARLVDDAGEYLLVLRNLRNKYSAYRSMALSPENNPIVSIEPERVHVWGERFKAGDGGP